MLHIESLIESEEEMYPTIVEYNTIPNSENIPSLSEVQRTKHKIKKKETYDETTENTDKDTDVLRVTSIRAISDAKQEQSDGKINDNTVKNSEQKSEIEKDLPDNVLIYEETKLGKGKIDQNQEFVEDSQTINIPHIEDEMVRSENLIKNEVYKQEMHNSEKNVAPTDLKNSDEDNVFSVFDETSIMKHVVNESHSREYSGAPENKKDTYKCENSKPISPEHTNLISDEKIEKKNQKYILSTGTISNTVLRSVSLQKTHSHNLSENTNVPIKSIPSYNPSQETQNLPSSELTSQAQENTEIQTASLDEEDMADIEAYLHTDTDLEEETQNLPSSELTSQAQENTEIQTASLDEEDMAKIISGAEDVSTQKPESSTLNISKGKHASYEHLVKEQCLNIEASLIHLEARLRRVLNLSQTIKKTEIFTTQENLSPISENIWDTISKEQRNALRIVCNAIEKHFQDTIRYSHFVQDDAYLYYKTLQKFLYL